MGVVVFVTESLEGSRRARLAGAEVSTLMLYCLWVCHAGSARAEMTDRAGAPAAHLRPNLRSIAASRRPIDRLASTSREEMLG